MTMTYFGTSRVARNGLGTHSERIGLLANSSTGVCWLYEDKLKQILIGTICSLNKIKERKNVLRRDKIK